MATRAQALLAARIRAQEERQNARNEYFNALQAGEVPMNSVLNNSLLSSSEQQNIWNTMAADQWQRRDRTSGMGMFSGTPNQLGMSLQELEKSELWRGLDVKSRYALLQRKYGTGIADRYASSLEDREAMDAQRRKTFDDAYETERTIAREKRQSQARLAATEPEMLHRKLMSGDWVVRGDGMFERNPLHNPSNPMNQEAPYVPLSPSGEATVARYWNNVMPGRANPLGQEKLARIQVAEENPNMSAEDIVKTAQARLASMAAMRENPARAIADMDEARALQGIAARQAAIPMAPGAPMYNVERSTPMSPPTVAAAPNSPTGNAFDNMRFGEKLRVMGLNAAQDFKSLARGAAQVLPYAESRIDSLGKFLERGGYAPEATRFFNDVMGNPSTELPAMPEPSRVREMESYRALPDWLK